MKELLAKVSLLTGARLAGVGFAFATSLIFTHAFGPEGLARYATAFAATSVAAVVMLAGFHAFAPVLAARYHAQDQLGYLHGLARGGWMLVASGTGVGVVLVALMAGLAGEALGPRFVEVAVFAALSAPAFALLMFHGGLLSGLQRQVAAQIPDSFVRPLMVLILMAGLWIMGPTVRFEWVLVFVATTLWLAALVQFRSIARALREHPAEEFKQDWRGWTRLAPSWMTIALVWDFGIDVFLLLAAVLASAEEIALLYVCFRYRGLAGFGMRSIYAVLQPKIYSAVTQARSEDVTRLIAMTNGTALTYALFALVGLWVLGPFLLGVFDPTFAEATGVLVLVALSFVARAVFGPALALLSIHNRQARIAAVLVVSLALSIVACVALYPVFGLVAIAGAYTGSTVVASAVLWLFARRLTGHDTSSWSSIGYGFRSLAGERQGIART